MKIAKPVPQKARKIGFEAPEEIHGAIKSVVGWAEMNQVRPLDKPFSEREFLQGLVAGFWAAGPDAWADLLYSNSEAIASLTRKTKPVNN